mmetsp:Transcript_12867/g.18988  ORF Transcript_12867/g.18988 Transcript_12867/m.18988 type:complete len:1186 (-) Transcript_12867:96-3653(-)
MLKAQTKGLSKLWLPEKKHTGVYSGGKVEVFRDGLFLACLHDANVIFLDVDTGGISFRLKEIEERKAGPAEEDQWVEHSEEELVCFCLNPVHQAMTVLEAGVDECLELVTASRNLLLRHWRCRPAVNQEGELSELSKGLQKWEIKCVRAIKAHTAPVLAMDYDPTGTLVVSGSADRSARVWDVERGYCTHHFSGHTGLVLAARFHPDPQRLMVVTGSEDATVRVWDLGQQESCVGVLRDHLSAVTSLAFAGPRAHTLVTAGRDQVVNFWDLRRLPHLLHTQPVYEEVEGLQVLPMGAGPGVGEEEGGGKKNKNKNRRSSGGGLARGYFATAGSRGYVRLWQFQEKEESEPQEKPGPDGRRGGRMSVTCVIGDGGVAAQADTGEVKGKKKGQKKQAPPAAKPGSSGGVVPPQQLCRQGLLSLHLVRRRNAAPSATQLLAVTQEHNFAFLDCRGLTPRRQLIGYNDEIVAVKHIPFWPSEASNEGEEEEGDEEEAKHPTGGRGSSSHKHVAPDSRAIVVASNTPQVRIFGLHDFACLTLDGHTDSVLAVDVSPDGRYVITSSKDNTCRLWCLRQSLSTDAEDEAGADGRPGSDARIPSALQGGWCVAVLRGHTQAVGACCFSRRRLGPDHTFIVSGSKDRTVKCWSLSALLLPLGLGAQGKNNKKKKNKKNQKEDPASAHAAAEAEAEAEAVATCSVLAHEKDINDLAVAPNDALVASASQDKTVKLWGATQAKGGGATLTALATLRGHRRGVWKVRFSPVDRCLASASADRTVRLWSLQPGGQYECLRTLQGHTASVLNIEFVSSGMQVVSSGTDGLLRLWTVRTSECDATLDAHSDRVWALSAHPCLGPGGSSQVSLVSGGADSALVVWGDATKQAEARQLREREDNLRKEEDLRNHLFRSDYERAVGLALELGHPYRLWTVLKQVMESPPPPTPPPQDQGKGSTTGASASRKKAYISLVKRHPTTEPGAGVGSVLAEEEGGGGDAPEYHPLDVFVQKWGDDKLSKALTYIHDWNTNSKYSTVAQTLLNSIFRVVPLQRLQQLPTARHTLNGLLAYSERHFQRLDRLVQSSYLVDYLLAAMRLTAPLSTNQLQESPPAHGPLAAEVHAPIPSLGYLGEQVVAEVESEDGAGSSSDSDDDGGVGRKILQKLPKTEEGSSYVPNGNKRAKKKSSSATKKTPKKKLKK